MNGIPKVYVATCPDGGSTFSFAAFCKVGHRVINGKAMDGMPTCGVPGCLCEYDAELRDLRPATPRETVEFWQDIADVARRAAEQE